MRSSAVAYLLSLSLVAVAAFEAKSSTLDQLIIAQESGSLTVTPLVPHGEKIRTLDELKRRSDIDLHLTSHFGKDNTAKLINRITRKQNHLHLNGWLSRFRTKHESAVLPVPGWLPHPQSAPVSGSRFPSLSKPKYFIKVIPSIEKAASEWRFGEFFRQFNEYGAITPNLWDVAYQGGAFYFVYDYWPMALSCESFKGFLGFQAELIDDYVSTAKVLMKLVKFCHSFDILINDLKLSHLHARKKNGQIGFLGFDAFTEKGTRADAETDDVKSLAVVLAELRFCTEISAIYASIYSSALQKYAVDHLFTVEQIRALFDPTSKREKEKLFQVRSGLPDLEGTFNSKAARVFPFALLHQAEVGVFAKALSNESYLNIDSFEHAFSEAVKETMEVFDAKDSANDTLVPRQSPDTTPAQSGAADY